MPVEYSIIIPTYKRSQSLERCLNHLERITHPRGDFELMVMDNGAEEKTKSLVNKFYKNFPNLRYYSVSSPGLHVCRNLGYSKAEGKILCYLDDDSYVDPSWLKGISEAFSNPDVVLVGGKILPEFETDYPHWIDSLWRFNQYGRYLSYYSLIDFGDDDFLIPAQFVWGCNFSIRKEILKESGGFHPDSFPEPLLKFRGDGESSVTRFIDSKKYRVYYSGKASIHHLVSSEKLTIDYLYNRLYKQGISDSYTLVRKHGGSFLSIMLRFYYWRSRALLKSFRHLIKTGNNTTKKRMEGGYWDGFRFHLKEVKQNPVLIDWILKNDYFGDDGMLLEPFDS